MTRTRIKICGITRAGDAKTAASLGCDAIGLVLWEKSSRYVTPVHAEEIVVSVPPALETVGVFVSPTVDEVASAVRKLGLQAAQLCGELPSGPWSELASQVRLIRSVGIGNKPVTEAVRIPGIDDYLFDTQDSRFHGGTGRVFDWSLITGQKMAQRVWLAGGLNAANVQEAIRTVRPYAVDVSSSVEESPGIKSGRKIEAFVQAVRTADEAETHG